jgi:UbiD family decarboxylase
MAMLEQAAIGDSPQSMRAFLARLDRCGELLAVDAPVEVDFEVPACLAEARDGPALCFRQPVCGGAVFDAPIVGNLMNALPRFDRRARLRST